MREPRLIIDTDFIAVMDDQTMVYVKGIVEENNQLKEVLKFTLDALSSIEFLTRYTDGSKDSSKCNRIKVETALEKINNVAANL